MHEESRLKPTTEFFNMILYNSDPNSKVYLRRWVSSVLCWGFVMSLWSVVDFANFSIPDPESKRPRIRIRSTELTRSKSIFNLKNFLPSFRKYDSGPLTWIPDPDFFPSRVRILIPGVKKHWIPDPDPQHWLCVGRMQFRIEKGRVSDLDPHYLSCWIRIRIQIADPDPGGQKWPTKIEKKYRIFMFWSASVAWASFMEA